MHKAYMNGSIINGATRNKDQREKGQGYHSFNTNRRHGNDDGKCDKDTGHKFTEIKRSQASGAVCP